MSRFGLIATALLFFAGVTVEPASAQQSDPPPQAPTQNWALPTPGRAQQNNQSQNNQSQATPQTPTQQPNQIQPPQTPAQPNPAALHNPALLPNPQNPQAQRPASRNQNSAASAAQPGATRRAAPVASKGSRRGKRTPEPEPVAVVPPPEQPTQPLRPSQMPPTTPQVTYRDGLLSILAENSTLADILVAVRKQTGAAIDMPASASNERVVMRIGPAPPRDVVSALLSGSPFDYVIVGAQDSPTALRRVIVSSRQSGGEMAPSPNPMSHPSYQRSAMPGMGAATAAEAEAADQSEEAPQPQRLATPIPMPGMGQPPAAAAGQAGALPPGSAPTVKTPEQLLDELKRMQQQQQQPPAQPPARPPL
jgi:hypothetical protein